MTPKQSKDTTTTLSRSILSLCVSCSCCSPYAFHTAYGSFLIYDLRLQQIPRECHSCLEMSPKIKQKFLDTGWKKTELWRICIIWFHLWIVRRICKNISRSTYHHIVVYFNEASYLLSCFVFKANALRSRSTFQRGMLKFPKQKFENWLNQTELWYFVFICESYE